MRPQDFVNDLADITLPAVFNPYSECCPIYDHTNAAILRRRNLESYITAALAHRVETIWIARDLGYRGGRRTGIPLTDEVHLDRIGDLFDGLSMERVTRGPVFKERTAATVWEVLLRIDQPVILWNIFPLHPHAPDNPFSNRRHTTVERNITSAFLPVLIDMINPKWIVAIGRDAQEALENTNVRVMKVRHPSYGGQREFTTGLFDLYDMS